MSFARTVPMHGGVKSEYALPLRPSRWRDKHLVVSLAVLAAYVCRRPAAQGRERLDAGRSSPAPPSRPRPSAWVSLRYVRRLERGMKRRLVARTSREHALRIARRGSQGGHETACVEPWKPRRHGERAWEARRHRSRADPAAQVGAASRTILRSKRSSLIPLYVGLVSCALQGACRQDSDGSRVHQAASIEAVRRPR